MEKNMITIFTDGASRGNPGRGGWGAVVSTDAEVIELGGREEHTTNNRMELSGALYALVCVSEKKLPGDILIYTDSQYLINGITKWVFGWKKNGWITKEKKDVVNRDLWEKLALITEGKKIAWQYVGGHVGIAGNERCDEIATSFADTTPISLYDGSRNTYPLSLTNILPNTEEAGEKKASRTHSKTKAYSYLSFLDGKALRHSTWAECEARVKGKNARFKKATSPAHETEILTEWGASL